MTAQEFPLAWRWTQSEHGIMPPHILARIVPLEASEAAQINERSLTFYQESRTLSPSVFGAIVSQRADIPVDEARAWLLEQQPSDLSVFVSWQHDLAVRTTWRVFVDYWDSFCYPSSDDVAVWPESEEWVLAYHHYELFEFGKKP
jgi:hypothetical protein